MNLNPFGGRGARRQTPRELRRECARLTADLTDRDARLAAADKLVADTAKERDDANAERDWFHDRWVETGRRALDAEAAFACVEKQLAAAEKKITDLEAIAGEHVDSADTPSPIYSEVTQDIPLPDGEDTLSIPVMSLVALGARS